MSLRRLLSLSLLLAGCGGTIASPGGDTSSGASGPAGNCATETIANDAVDYGRLAVDGDTVFWDTTDGRLMRHDSSGTIELADISLLYVTVDATNVYGLTTDSVVAVPRAGGAPVTLAAERAFSPVLRDDTLFYVAPDAAAIVALGPLHGNTARSVVVDHLTLPYELAVDDSFVYFECADNGAAPLSLWRASRDPSSGVAPVRLATTHELGSLAVSNRTVYYADGTDNVNSEILKITGTGAPEVVVPISPVSTDPIVLDGAFGYDGAQDTAATSTTLGRVYRFAVDGSSNTLLVDLGMEAMVSDVRVGSDAIYFTTLSGSLNDTGTVRKTCK